MKTTTKRVPFCLIFSNNPPAADVVRQNLVQGDFKVGAEVSFKWTKSKTETEAEDVQGKILDIGTMTRLKLVNVTSSGLIRPAEQGQQMLEQAEDEGLNEVVVVGTRRQELEKIRYQQAHAKDNNLQDMSDDLLARGPDSFCTRPVVSRVPKKRSAEHLREVDEKLKNLPCSERGVNKVEIITNSNIWIDAGKLAILRQQYQKAPSTLFDKIMQVAMGDMMHCDGVSAKGLEGCTVGVPVELVGPVVNYVRGVFVAAGGEAAAINYDPIRQLSVLISNSKARNKKKKCTATNQQQLNPENPLRPAPTQVPQPHPHPVPAPAQAQNPAQHHLPPDHAQYFPQQYHEPIHPHPQLPIGQDQQFRFMQPLGNNNEHSYNMVGLADATFYTDLLSTTAQTVELPFKNQ